MTLNTGQTLILLEGLVFGAYFFLLGILIRLGIYKGWFAESKSAGSSFGYIPLGLTMILGCVWVGGRFTGLVTGFWAGWCVPWLIIFFPLSGLSLFLMIRQPVWIQPAWYRWLINHHSDILEILREEATKQGARTWSRRVRTQKGLEQWVLEVRKNIMDINSFKT